jgi:hypothetical protein
MRGICSSCQQKRAEILSAYLEEEVIEEINHRQFVYVIPKKFRHLFLQNRYLLKYFLRAAVDATQAFFQYGLKKKDVKVGIVAMPQMFGDRINPHPHIHALVTEGAFDQQGKFYQLNIEPQLEIHFLTRLFAEKLLSYLVSTKCLRADFREEILSWEHSGFSVDASVRVEKGDVEKFRRLVRYMARPAISQERLKYDPKTGEVRIYSTKKTLGRRKWVATYDAFEFLALLSLQVPPRGTHMVRYYGAYSIRRRALRRGKEAERKGEDVSQEPEEVDSPTIRERKKRWAQLIRYVFETDPLECTNCGAEMYPRASVAS